MRLYTRLSKRQAASLIGTIITTNFLAGAICTLLPAKQLTPHQHLNPMCPVILLCVDRLVPARMNEQTCVLMPSELPGLLITSTFAPRFTEHPQRFQFGFPHAFEAEMSQFSLSFIPHQSMSVKTKGPSHLCRNSLYILTAALAQIESGFHPTHAELVLARLYIEPS